MDTTTAAAAAPHPAGHVVDQLVHAHLLDPARREQALGVVAGALVPLRPAPAGGARGMSALVEVVAYLGAALVLAASGLFAASLWEDLGFATQVGVVGVAALALGAAGLAVPHRGQDARRRLASTLLTGAAALVALLVGLLVDRAGGTPSGYDDTLDLTLLTASLAGLAGVLLGYRRAPGALGQLGTAAAAGTAVVALLGPLDSLAATVLVETLAVGALAALWLLAAERRWWREPVLARVLGVAHALWAVQVPVLDGAAWVGYLLTALLAVLGTAAYLRSGSWPYLAVVVVAVTLVVPEAVTDWTGGGLGAVGAVLLTGVTLLLASLLGAWLRARRPA